MAVLFTFGADDQGTAMVRADANGQLNIYTTGNSNVLGMVNLDGLKSIPFMIYGPNSPQPPVRLPEKPSLVFNQISEPESHAFALDRCIELCNMLGCPVINHPREVKRFTREHVMQVLQGIPGLKAPVSVRCAPRSPDEVLETAEKNGIAYPFIFRTAGEHNGRNMVLVSGRDELDQLHAFPFDGRDFFIIEFVDYANPAGIYCKHRLVVIDRQIFPHHHSFHQQWKVHVSSGGGLEFMAAHPEHGTALENLRRLDEVLMPRALPVLQEIAQRINLDYFVMDCHIHDDGQVLLFEANANVNAMQNVLPGVQAYIDRITARMSAFIREKSGENH